MNAFLSRIRALFDGDRASHSVVPPSGYTANLTVFTAAAMSFLAVFAIALSVATDRLADHWAGELARTATVRISAPADQVAAQTQAALRVLETTPGVAESRAFEAEEQMALLTPWFGPDLPVETLPIPQLIEVVEDEQGLDAEGLKLRLAAEVPGAIFDDHTRWRRPLVAAASRLQTLGLVSIVIIAGATAAMITLAANSALAANAQIIGVLRLVGARDIFIARAFVRRFTFRAFAGGVLGAVLAAIALLFLPNTEEAGGFLTGLSFVGWNWLLPLAVPFLAGFVAYAATRFAALRVLKGLT
ncbi:cell division protein FtsX [Halocynthiibacter sp. C4]|uniref:cell division protein FtsX n=1 Tax=Halocynthiibacter sp. C4 TaxID=2992758 RepID=UPI00237BC31B|nr:FtsX-like permease family protein [Halocynthiibacter sp. C4]MDE0590736.1 cell division protein FtsX [Halocynthiibacter sp. C4]